MGGGVGGGIFLRQTEGSSSNISSNMVCVILDTREAPPGFRVFLYIAVFLALSLVHPVDADYRDDITALVI